MAERLPFFEERTINQINHLNLLEIVHPALIIEQVRTLNPAKEALLISVPITPKRFLSAPSSQEASKKCYKYGDLISLNQPRTPKQAQELKKTPLEILLQDLKILESKEKAPSEYIGYSFQPIQGDDKRKKIVPFSWLLEATRLASYELQQPQEFAQSIEKLGSKIKPYGDAKATATQGSTLVVLVPSRTRQEPYEIKVQHLPTQDNQEKFAIIYSLITEGGPPHSFWNIKYPEEEKDDTFTFYPHSIKAVLDCCIYYKTEHDNLVPYNLTPFFIPSKALVDIYKRIKNNLVIKGTGNYSSEKLRKPHLDEVCILSGQAITQLGIPQSLWQSQRDGKLKDYNWSLPK